MRVLMALVLLAAVAAIFIMPSVTLPKSILEAQQHVDDALWLLSTWVVPEPEFNPALDQCHIVQPFEISPVVRLAPVVLTC
jgi:hypothetical protein